MDRNEAREALDAVARSDRRMVGHTRWPLWRHAAFGAVQAMLVLAWGVPLPAMAALIMLAIGAMFWIMRDDRRRYGMFVDGWSSDAARPATLAGVAIFLLGLAAIIFLGEGPNRWSPVVGVVTIIVFAGSTLLSLWWQKLYHDDMMRERGHGG